MGAYEKGVGGAFLGLFAGIIVVATAIAALGILLLGALAIAGVGMFFWLLFDAVRQARAGKGFGAIVRVLPVPFGLFAGLWAGAQFSQLVWAGKASSDHAGTAIFFAILAVFGLLVAVAFHEAAVETASPLLRPKPAARLLGCALGVTLSLAPIGAGLWSLRQYDVCFAQEHGATVTETTSGNEIADFFLGGLEVECAGGRRAA